MTTDHAPRIRAQQQQAVEIEAIRTLSEHAAPLLWPVLCLAIAAVFCFAESAFGGDILYYADHIEIYLDMAAQHEALVQCMNGQVFSLGDEGLLRCQIIKYDLVQGVKS